jgi:hypothetical protein
LTRRQLEGLLAVFPFSTMALTRRTKVLLIVLLTPVVLLIALAVAAFLPVVQTMAARKALEGQGEVENVSVGMGGAELRGLKWRQPGVEVSVPNFRADVPLFDLAGGRVDLRSLVAKDMVIELDPDLLAEEQKKAKPAAEEKPATPFAGILNLAVLPADLRAEGIDVTGIIRVAGKQPLEAVFALTGGGMKAGQEGTLELKVEAKAGMGAVTAKFTLRPKVGADGRIDALGAVAEALATSKLLAEPARLRASVDIVREGEGEAYGMRLIAGEAPLVELETKWAPGVRELPGKWKLSVRDTDLSPFVLGLALPVFNLQGAGDLAVSDGSKLRMAGKLTIAADELETFGLPKLGPVTVATEFALTGTAEELRVASVKLEVAGATPVMALATKQGFVVKLADNTITPSRAGDELATVELLGLPADWVKLVVPELTLAGPVAGAWSVRAAELGYEVSATAPLVVSGPRYVVDGKELIALEAVRIEGLSAKQTKAGFDATVEKLSLVANGADIVAARVTAQQSEGGAMEARIDLNAVLSTLADQPVLRGKTRLSAGKAGVQIVAKLAGGSTVVQAQVRLTGLRAAGAGDLPEVSLDADVTRDAAGTITAKLPISVRNVAAKRSSDLELNAKVTSVEEGMNVVAKLESQILHVADLQAFAAAAAETVASEPAPASAADAKPVAPTAPLWAGVTGELEIALARLVYAPGIEVLNTKGRVALTSEEAAVQALQTVLGTGGALDINGGLRWLPASGGYALAADVKGKDVTVGPLLKALNPAAAAPLEGTYDLGVTMAGEGADPAAAAGGAAVELTLNGRQGVLRALNFETSRFAKLASPRASEVLGLLGALAGDSGVGQAAGYASAAIAVTRQLSNLPYDEIVLKAKRGADGSVEVGTLSLLSPQLRLTGGGGLRMVAGRSLWELPLKLQLQLDAKGEISSSLAKLNLLAEPAADGFSPMKEQLLLDGTLKQVGTAQVTRLLMKAAGF